MKKTYITPELEIELVQPEGMMALSLVEGTADSSDALVKEETGEWEDIWE